MEGSRVEKSAEIGNEVTLNFGKVSKTFKVIKEPVPHILVESKKELHGWEFYDYTDCCHRECSQERALINPYNGCWQNGCTGCWFCYTKGLWGYFRLFWTKGIATVFKDFDLVVKNQVSKLHACPTLYLSPTTDPFMDLEGEYHISKKTIEHALEVNLPSEFITKMGENLLRWKGYPELVDRMAKHPHCFGQFTVYTANEGVRKLISPGSSSIDQQFEAMKMCSEKGLLTVCRIDPFIPFVTDSEEDLNYIVSRAKNSGARHIIASCIDVPSKFKKAWLNKFAFLTKELRMDAKTFSDFALMFREEIKGDFNAKLSYRREKFAQLRKICNDHGLTLSFCMEFWQDDAGVYHGLNDEFATSSACEGMNIPMYVRTSLKEKFQPLEKCDGNCLKFAKGKGSCDGACEHESLMLAKKNKYKDYREFGRSFSEKKKEKIEFRF